MLIRTETYEGMPGGMNLARPSQEIEPNEAKYLQDLLIDYQGIMRRRGPVVPITGYYEWDETVHGVASTLDPNGSVRVAVWRGAENAQAYLDVLASDGQSVASIPWGTAVFNSTPPSNPYPLTVAKPALGGGALLGSSDAYYAGSSQMLVYWYGANKPDYATGTVTYTRGDTTVTGSGTSWLANVVPGMFLFAQISDPTGVTGQVFIGIVREVVSNTEITLWDKILWDRTGSATYNLTSIRGIMPKIMKGTLTASTTDPTVTGGKTKFRDWDLAASGSKWCLYRAADREYIGQVSSVTTNISLELTANAAISMANERYIAVNAAGDWSYDTYTASATYPTKPGFITATYAERQWYANNARSNEDTFRVHFSDANDFEAIDMASFDGDHISIADALNLNTPILEMIPAYNSLVVLKEGEVVGIFGSGPSTFATKKLSDDGPVNGNTAQSWLGGVLWAGKDSINYFDGVQVESLTENKLGDYYKKLMRSFDPTSWRVYSMISRDHYFLYFERCSPSVVPWKGDVPTAQNTIVLALNLETRAFNVFTNLGVRGSTELPASTGWDTWYVVNAVKGNGLTVSEGNFVARNGSTVSDNSVNVKWGSASKQVVTPGSTPNEGAESPTPRITVSATTSYKFGVWVKGDSGYSMRLSIDWYNSGGSYISSDTAAFTADTAFKLQTITATSPGTAASAIVAVEMAGTTAGTFHIDGPTFYLTTDWVDYVSGMLCDANDIFDSTGNDPYACHNMEAGPDFYIESRRFNAGDSLRRKHWKDVWLNYLSSGGGLVFDIVRGLNVEGEVRGSFIETGWDYASLGTAYSTYSAVAAVFGTYGSIDTDSIFRPRRAYINTNEFLVAFRVYEDAGVTHVVTGPYRVGYKYQRVNRLRR